MKKCNKCGIEKELILFVKHNQTKSGYSGTCKECRNKKERNSINKKISDKLYYEKNKIIINVKRKVYKKKNMEKIKESGMLYRANNKDTIAIKKSTYKKNNRDRANFAYALYMQNNPLARIAHSLRNRTIKALKNNYKSGSAIRDLGCSIEEFKKYLENRFYLNKETNEIMSWDNYGSYGWHIDHIKPLSSFDLSNKEEFLKAVNYTNLQPLWAKENLSKGAKIL